MATLVNHSAGRRRYGLHVRNKSWIPDSRRYPNKRPDEPFKVPRYLAPHARHLNSYLPKELVPLIMNYAFNFGPRSRLNATIIHDYSVADRFYRAILFGGLRISTRLMWLPMPYHHELREEAIERFIDFSDVPWDDH